MYVVQTNFNVILVFASVKEDVQGHASPLIGSMTILMILIALMDQMKVYVIQTNSNVLQVNVNGKEDALVPVFPLNGSMIILMILIALMDQMKNCPRHLLLPLQLQQPLQLPQLMHQKVNQ